MVNKYVGDEKVIIGLQGLRFIKKTNSVSAYESYYLEWEYKGSKGQARYEKEEDRDALYNKIKSNLCAPSVPRGEVGGEK